jgi:glycosyltransferase 2 family protein
MLTMPLRRYGMGNPTRLRALLVCSGVLTTLVFTYLAVRGVDFGTARDALRDSDPIWLAPAVVVLAVAVFLRILRWRYLFGPATRPSVRAATSAYLVGQFFNSILPLRAGEAARIVALQRRGKGSRGETTATVLLERAYDVLVLLAMLFVLAPWLPPESWLGTAAIVAVVSVVVFVALIVVLAVYGDRPLLLLLTPLRIIPAIRPERIAVAATNVGSGLAAVRGLRSGVTAVVLTASSWIIMGISFWLIALAFPLPHSPLVGILVVIATNLVQILPSAPAAVGVFEAATLVSLASYGASKSVALSYAVVLHLANFIPYLLLGPLAFRGMSLAALRARPDEVGPV